VIANILPRFSIFMLLGLLTTIRMLPSSESNAATSAPKTLEQWALGRPVPNTFATAPLSLFIARNYHFIVRIVDRIYLTIDGLMGGDEKERREDAKRPEVEAEREMRVIEEVGRRPGSFRDMDGGGGERGPSPFVNGRVDRPEYLDPEPGR
jgi:MFS transporter, PHS family, inorganic phosphate transporter